VGAANLTALLRPLSWVKYGRKKAKEVRTDEGRLGEMEEKWKQGKSKSVLPPQLHLIHFNYLTED